MVQFQVMSDLHLEMYKNEVLSDRFIVPTEDYLILAGDICHLNFGDRLANFLIDLCRKFKKVYYVLGNHEFYRTEGYTTLSIQDCYEKFYEIKSRIPNLYLLDKKYDIIDNVCIIGCTLWSYTDYVPKYIVRIEGINTQLYRNMFNSDLRFIEEKIEYCKRHRLKLIVVTHYPPTLHAISKHKSKRMISLLASSTLTTKKDRFASLYATDLSRLLSSDKVHTWVFGHVHKNFDYITSGGTRVVTNQQGKPADGITDFSLNKTIVVNGDVEDDINWFKAEEDVLTFSKWIETI